MNYLASNLKHLRKSYGETQEELAKALYLEKNTISQYESGSRKPDEETLKGITKRYGVTMDSLLYEDLSFVPDMLAYYSDIDSNFQMVSGFFPIYFFRIFLRISARKTASITGCCKFSCAVFFLAFFMHIKIEITNTQQRKE